MKARQDFEVFVDKNFNRVNHSSGNAMTGKKRLEIKKGDEIPKELNADLLQYNPDYIDLTTVTDKEREFLKKPKPKIVPRKHSLESLTKYINTFGRKRNDALEALRDILKEEFNYKSSSRRLGFLRNKILTLQEKRRRTG